MVIVVVALSRTCVSIVARCIDYIRHDSCTTFGDAAGTLLPLYIDFVLSVVSLNVVLLFHG